ncbi:NPC intracellular cholesterol transporter 1-like isoform X2 [Triticum urartu]|uniref:NPC intracellular cholesterol transporter 1-like isoform X2 n=1 Tax=Triticum urartu TaxID=4572 RepID=UPI0020432031|nr:NPC intracellular cholesterol transporter 1-like isoform X2 [Triticum urartu]
MGLVGPRRGVPGGAVVFATAVALIQIVFLVHPTSAQQSPRVVPAEGYCSMYGICANRTDGKVLNCVNATKAVKPDTLFSTRIQSLCPTITGDVCCTVDQFDTLHQQVQQAVPFLVGCPACLRNFLNLFCEMSCSPNQSLFINVTSAKQVKNITTVDGIDYYITSNYGEELYNSCKEVKFGTLNTRAMDFLGGGAKTYKEWLAFLGRQANPNEPGSPYLITYRPDLSGSSGVKPLNTTVYSCGDPSLGCSCGDCPSSSVCMGSLLPQSMTETSCSVKMGSLKAGCLDFSLAVVYIVFLCAILLWGLLYRTRGRTGFPSQTKPPKNADDKLHSNNNGNVPENSVQVPKAASSSIVQTYMSTFFRRHGVFVTRHPLLVLCASLLVPILLCIGLIRFKVETRPEKLWVSPGSQTAYEKQYFDSHLAPFYRIEQLVLATSASGQLEAPTIVNDNNFKLLFQIQKKIDDLRANYSGSTVSLADICLKPLSTDCATQSVLQHYSSEETCLSTFQSPIDPSTILGGFPGSNFTEASAFVITYPVNNKVETTGQENGKAMAWERAYINLVKEEILPMVLAQNLTLSFSSESSIKDELNRESTADAITIVVSYIVMFAYISFTLGDRPSRLWALFVSSKVLLGLSGVVLVMLSVLGSMGFFSAVGVKSTLIIMEVIPFLVLAVGVDNMCILVHAVKRQPDGIVLEERISNALVEVGPSITLASLAEVLAFSVSAINPMPATRAFSMFAAMAVLLDFLLQVTAFVALIVYDFRRAEDGRIDCVPCARLKSSTVAGDNGGHQRLHFVARYMKDIHGPILGYRPVKFIVIAVFVGLAFASIAMSTRLQPGLEQKIVLPRDSYLQGYFDDLEKYMKVGPPLYFVVKNFNYSSASENTNQICSINQCNSNSLLNEIARQSLSPETSYIAKPAASWLDDFLIWMSPEAFGCCRKFVNGNYCPPDDQPPCCQLDQDSGSCSSNGACNNCTTCFLHSDLHNGRPSTTQFKEKLPWFLDALPSSDCSKGGKGAYSTSLDLSGYENGNIQASAFRTYHTPLNKQTDYVNSLRAARDFSSQMSKDLQMEIFPYSVFHIFFEQYLSVWKTAIMNICVCLGAVFVVCLVVTSSLWASAIILIVLAMIVLDLMGVMAVLGIQLNAISIVNLVMSIGIAVEFCVHITHAFMIGIGDRENRVRQALSTMGASVFSGITLTKLVGVIVLRFAKSEVFVVYYFQMYLALVLIGFLHGLIFLPVVLSLCGPPQKTMKPIEQSQTPPSNEQT